MTDKLNLNNIIRFGMEIDTSTMVYSSCDLVNPSNTDYQRKLENGLVLEMSLSQDSGKRIWRRSDAITNTSDQAIEVEHPVLTFVLPGNSAIRVQKSTWSKEEQPDVINLDASQVSIGSKGRTCSGFVPYFAIDSDTLGNVIFNLLPGGDWRVVFEKSDADGMIQIKIDRYDDDHRILIAPGERYDFGLDCLLQAGGEENPDIMGYNIQSYASSALARRPKTTIPVVYNTWYDRYYKISIESMKAQLDAAAEIGCEVFVVDAGWYGSHVDDWAAIGDWYENPNVFADVTLADFAEMVRSKGLGFGIWMEPERVNKTAQVCSEHPEWFIQTDDEEFYYPDLVKPEARNWVLSEMTKTIETYQLKWIKIDCNSNFSADPHHTGHSQRMHVWYGILDELAQRFPDLIIEGCASGGLRNDLSTASHFHTNFLSDTVDPIDIIRIGMSALSRLPVGMTAKWATLYPSGSGWTPYGKNGLDTGDFVLCISPAGREGVSSYHLDFATRAAMTGAMGISGNIAGLSKDIRRLLSDEIAFYIKHREFIQPSVGLPLTPIEVQNVRDGVAAIQLADASFNKNMIFVYNLASPTDKIMLRPLNLDPQALFNLWDMKGVSIGSPRSGSDLAKNGLEMQCKSGHAEVFFIDRI